jgi:hypothetical protein
MAWSHPVIAEHLLPAWIDERCELGRSLFEYAGALYDSWRDYAHGRGAEPGSPSEFAEAMERKGFERDRLPGDRRRIRWGLRLRRGRSGQRPWGEGKSSLACGPSAPPPPAFGDFFSAERSFGGPIGAGLALGRSTPSAGQRTPKIGEDGHRGDQAGSSALLRACETMESALRAATGLAAIIFQRRVR